MTTGLTPYSKPVAAGTVPNRTYAHAITTTMSAAGRMKHTPATSSPGQPRRP